MSLRVSLLAAAAVLVLPALGHADGNPSADQILNALAPRAGMAGGTRGIRPIAPDVPDAEPAPGQPTAATGQAASRHPARHAAARAPVEDAPADPHVDLTVQFANGSAQLTPAAMRTLDELGRALGNARLAGDRFRIEGHTDTVGTPDSNKVLSTQRSQSVVAYLVGRFHVPVDKLQPVGMGEDGLLVPTDANTAEPRNRRVVVVNLGT